jgi:hypothetical protein
VAPSILPPLTAVSGSRSLLLNLALVAELDSRYIELGDEGDVSLPDHVAKQ